MSPAPAITEPIAAAAARRIAAGWRKLASHDGAAPGRTLLACSGGADSSAMVLALSRLRVARSSFVVAHIRHDLRPEPAARHDEARAAALAERVDLPFTSAAVRVGPGNAEAEARKVRYKALARIARAHGCRFIATAHHADDQLETLLMRLASGSGTAGIAGVRVFRRLSDDVDLIRPCLSTTHEQLRAICNAAEWHWAEDETNSVETSAGAAARETSASRRAMLRASVIPALREAFPEASRAATRTAASAADDALALERLAQRLVKLETAGGASIDRALVRAEDPAAGAAVLRAGVAAVNAGRVPRSLTRQALSAMIETLRGRGPMTPIRFGGLVIEADEHSIRIVPASSGANDQSDD